MDLTDELILFIIIVFQNIAVRDVEHRTVAANEHQRAVIGCARGVQCAENDFFSAGIHFQLTFNILDIILAEREYRTGDVGRDAAARKVFDLEGLINGDAVITYDGTRTGRKAPCVQRTVVVEDDGSAVFYDQLTVCAGDLGLLTAAGRKQITGKAQRRTFRKGQCRARLDGRLQEQFMSLLLGHYIRLYRINRMLIAVRDQQGRAGRNGSRAVDLKVCQGNNDL